MVTLAVKARDKNTAVEALRKEGQVPAVFYGPKEQTTSIAIDALAFAKIWREAGETTIVKLTGVGDEKETLIHDVQFHPVTDRPLHADFYVLEKGKKVTLKIPLEFVGLAPAEKAGHIVVKALHEVEIEVAPAELPKSLAVDLSALENVGDHIVASQIKLPPSAALKTHADEIVVSITAFVEEKIEEPAVAAPVEGAAPAAEGAPGPEGTPSSTAPTAEKKKES